MPIKAVLFDLDGTLIERPLNASETFQRILTSRGIHVSVEEIKQALLKVERDLEDAFEEHHGKIPVLDFYSKWSFLVLEAMGIEDKNGDISREAYERCLDLSNIRVYPDTKSTLAALRGKGIKVGIVSGGYEEEIQKMLELVDLDEASFDIIVGSNTIKKRKPDPGVFRYALETLGVEPEEAIFVGDSLEKDYRAALGIGMKPLLLVTPEDTVSEDVKKIDKLMSLIEYLD